MDHNTLTARRGARHVRACGGCAAQPAHRRQGPSQAHAALGGWCRSWPLVTSPDGQGIRPRDGCPGAPRSRRSVGRWPEPAMTAASASAAVHRHASSAALSRRPQAAAPPAGLGPAGLGVRCAQARLQRRLVQAAPGRRAACRVRASRLRFTRCTGSPPAPPCPGSPRPPPCLQRPTALAGLGLGKLQRLGSSRVVPGGALVPVTPGPAQALRRAARPRRPLRWQGLLQPPGLRAAAGKLAHQAALTGSLFCTRTDYVQSRQRSFAGSKAQACQAGIGPEVLRCSSSLQWAAPMRDSRQSSRGAGRAQGPAAAGRAR